MTIRAGVFPLQRLNLGDRDFGLRPGRHQRGAVDEAPTVILRMSDLDTPCTERHGQFDHLAGARDIGAMDHGIDGQRQAIVGDGFGDDLFLRVGAFIIADPVGGFSFGVLDRELNVIEPGVGKRLHFLRRQSDAGCDEIGIEPDLGAMRDDLKEIMPRRRLATREMRVQNTGGRGFGEDTQPCLRVEFVGTGIHFERIGTIRATERATMREFGEKADRRGYCGFRRHNGSVHRSTIRFVASSESMARTSLSMVARSALKVAARLSTISLNVATPSHRFKISTAIASVLTTRSGASKSHSLRVSSSFSRTPRGRCGFD